MVVQKKKPSFIPLFAKSAPETTLLQQLAVYGNGSPAVVESVGGFCSLPSIYSPSPVSLLFFIIFYSIYMCPPFSLIHAPPILLSLHPITHIFHIKMLRVEMLNSISSRVKTTIDYTTLPPRTTSSRSYSGMVSPQ